MVHPDVGHLDAAGRRGTRDEVDCEFLPTDELLEERVLRLPAVWSDRPDNLRRCLDRILLVVADEYVHRAHPPRRLDHHGIIQFQLLHGLGHVLAISRREPCVPRHPKSGVGHGHLHETLVATRARESQVVHDRQPQERAEYVREVHRRLSAGHDAEEAQVLLALDRLEVCRALDHVELGPDRGLVDLVHADLEQRLGRGIQGARGALAIAAANDAHDHEPSLTRASD
mmetsp:Transcript_2716/g.6021  ORF Transcript_2716/g.6021 Transcript_2716/m.6021 type:complete len:228 (+) Transcript_2716:698-1381(+)